MITIDHGNWTRYDKPQLKPLPAIAKGDTAEMERRSKMAPHIFDAVTPDNVAYAKRDDGVDWYDFLDGYPFIEGSVVTLLNADGVVVDAANDATRLFPAGLKVVEVQDYSDKPEGLVNKRFDAKGKRFDDTGQRVVMTLADIRTLVADLVQRVDRLERK